jgi:hypothetical protein
MAASSRLSALGLSLLAWALGSSCTEAAVRGSAKITGPYARGNLAVFLIHGQGVPTSRPLLTLQEAIEQHKVIIHETGQVNELAVETVSPDADVYIQAGDIVKGGRQDRMISQDVIVPALSGRVPLASFCVEQGRWSRRGNEAAHAFSASSDQAVGGALKIAARRQGDQSEVWRQVAAAQEKLGKSLGAPVAAPASASSLQLTLENARVKAGVDEYLRALSGRGTARRDVVGCAFAVNGRLSSAEIYASADLFRRLWPKLLKAAAVEAVAEQGGAVASAPAPADVRAWVAETDRARGEERVLSPRVKLLTRESGQGLLFETQDRERKDDWLHRSYVAK